MRTALVLVAAGGISAVALTPGEYPIRAVPATAVLPCFKVKVAVVIVKGSIASLKAALMVWLIATAVAALPGTVAFTIGRVVSGVTPVVKLQLKSAVSAVPARFLAPVVRVAVYTVRGARLAVGLKVAVTPA